MATIKSTAKLLLNGQSVAGKKLKAKDLTELVPDTTNVVTQKSKPKIEYAVEELAQYYERIVKDSAIASSALAIIKELFGATNKSKNSTGEFLKEAEFFTKLDLFKLGLPDPQIIKYNGSKVNLEVITLFGTPTINVKSESDYWGFSLRLGKMAIHNINELIDKGAEESYKKAISKTAFEMKNYVSAIYHIRGNYLGRGFYVFRKLHYYTGLDLDALIESVINSIQNEKYINTRIKYFASEASASNSEDNIIASQSVTIYVSFNTNLLSSDIVQEGLIKLYKTKIDIMQRYNYVQPNYAAGELVPEIMIINKEGSTWNTF